MKTLEVGKWYTSRCGKKWFVTAVCSDRFVATNESSGGLSTRTSHFAKDGSYYEMGGNDVDDLIIPANGVTPHLDVILAVVQGKVAECYDILGKQWYEPLGTNTTNPVTHPHLQWRIKPEKKTMKIGDVTIVAPETEPLEQDTLYFSRSSLNDKPRWTNHSVDDSRLKNGEIFLTMEDAIAANNAINKLFKKK